MSGYPPPWGNGVLDSFLSSLPGTAAEDLPADARSHPPVAGAVTGSVPGTPDDDTTLDFGREAVIRTLTTFVSTAVLARHTDRARCERFMTVLDAYIGARIERTLRGRGVE